jgi:hypothetical protein
MKIETRIILRADEGKWLTDGEVYGRVIMLGEDRSAEEFHEITQEEYDVIIAEQITESEGYNDNND